jgi:flagellar biogenesis protein FliO
VIRAALHRAGVAAGAALLGLPSLARAANTPLVSPAPVVPDAGVSVLRVLGALALVLALFFGGVWLARNRRRFLGGRDRVQRLRVLEARPIGGRHTLYVVGYERQRLLLAASPSGVALLSHLPEAKGDEPLAEGDTAHNFATVLQKVLGQK